MLKRLLCSIAGLVAAGAVVAPATASAAEAPAGPQAFVAQSRAAGLTGEQASWLQAEAERYLAAMGGKQVAPNRIEVEGRAEVSIALPGDAHPRDLSGRGAVALAGPCDGGTAYGHFCAYQRQFGTGTQIDMYRCGNYDLPNWVGYGSWGNNQTRGTVAVFWGKVWPYDSSTAPSNDQSYDWTPVWTVTNC